MNTNRRDFLKDTAFAAFAAGLAGCATSKAAGGGVTGSLVGFRTAPMDRIRVGFIGVGERGMAALHRVMLFKGVEVTAVGDIRTEAAEEGVAFLKKWKLPGSDAVKAYWTAGGRSARTRTSTSSTSSRPRIGTPR